MGLNRMEGEAVLKPRLVRNMIRWDCCGSVYIAKGPGLNLTPRPSACRFTQNLSVFRREVNDSMKNSTYGVNSNDMMS